MVDQADVDTWAKILSGFSPEQQKKICEKYRLEAEEAVAEMDARLGYKPVVSSATERAKYSTYSKKELRAATDRFNDYINKKMATNEKVTQDDLQRIHALGQNIKAQKLFDSLSPAVSACPYPKHVACSCQNQN